MEVEIIMATQHALPVNATGFVDWVQWTDTATKGFYGDVVLWILVVIVFFGLKKTDAKKAFAGSTFIGSILGVMLYQLGIVSMASITILIIGLAIGVMWLLWDKPT